MIMVDLTQAELDVLTRELWIIIQRAKHNSPRELGACKLNDALHAVMNTEVALLRKETDHA